MIFTYTIFYLPFGAGYPDESEDDIMLTNYRLYYNKSYYNGFSIQANEMRYDFLSHNLYKDREQVLVKHKNSKLIKVLYRREEE